MAHKENIEKHIKTHTHAHEQAQANKDIDCAHVLCVLYVGVRCVCGTCASVCVTFTICCVYPFFHLAKKNYEFLM